MSSPQDWGGRGGGKAAGFDTLPSVALNRCWRSRSAPGATHCPLFTDHCLLLTGTPPARSAIPTFPEGKSAYSLCMIQGRAPAYPGEGRDPVIGLLSLPGLNGLREDKKIGGGG